MAAGDLTRPASTPRGRRGPGVCVFVYHGIGPKADFRGSSFEKKYWVDSIRFRGHLQCITEGGLQEKLLRDLWGCAASHDDTCVAPVVLTFDDGLASCYSVAFPLLLEAGLRAEFFVNTSTVGKPGYLGWSQMLEMKSAGMSIQSHGHEHVVLPLLSAPSLERQLRKPKAELEDRLGSPVEFLAVPYGFVNARVLDAARRIGYKAVCVSGNLPARPGRRVIHRIAVHEDTSLDSFREMLDLPPSFYLRYSVRPMLTFLPKQVLVRLSPGRLGVRIHEGGS